MNWTSLQLDIPSDIKPRIEIVSATRHPASVFWKESALGASLRRMAYDMRVTSRILAANTQGLPTVYNSRIEADDSAEILVFMHDDVWIDDFMIVDRVLDGLAQFDLIGIAGNRRRLPNQITWPGGELGDGPTGSYWPFLSGAIAHGKEAFSGFSILYGPAPAECELMDGVFLAVKKATLLSHGLRFDPRFDFHFYDLDFCRTARDLGLRLGTWPIALTHQSRGGYNTPAWNEKARMYLEKWADADQPPAA